VQIRRGLIISILTILSYARSQVGCENADLEMGNFTNWTGQTGYCCGIYTPNDGIINGRHTIMSGSAIDPYSCGNVPVVAPGSIYSARLGNDDVDNEAERLTYTFTITPTNTLIIYKYAVILEDPNHSPWEQPRFEAKLMDQFNNVIPCTEYYVAAGPSSGFQNCGWDYQYLPWTTIGVDVSDYVGQNVTIDFSTGDCSLGGHFGYAYVEASCSEFAIDTRYCITDDGQNSTELEAPVGFQNYLWSNGSTSNITTVENATTGQIVTCQITSVNGCVATLEAALTPSDVSAAFINSSVCSGDTISLINTTTYENAVNQSMLWSSSDGFSTSSEDFVHVFSAPGTYQVELFVESDAGCVDSITQSITVYDLPIADISISDVCVGQNTLISSESSIQGNSPLLNTWIVNGISSSGPSVIIPTAQADTVQVQLISVSQNNCSDTITESIIVYSNPVAGFSYSEVCANDPMSFTDTSILYSNQNSLSWLFNNQEIGNTSDLEYTFSSSGNMTVTLIVQDNYPTVSCSDTITESFIVHGIPIISYSGDTTICEDLPFSFSNNSSNPTGEIMNYEWFVSNNSVSTSTDLFYTIYNEGIYPITLSATSTFGCENDTTFNLYVYPIPEAPIVSATTPLCPGDAITFNAEAEPNSTINWFGPQNFEENSFSFTMPFEEDQMGYYSAFISSQYGCISDTAEVFASILFINDFEDFVFPNVITANNDGTNDELNIHENFKTCEEYTLYIFNRWGNLVFEQTLYSPQFRGKTLSGDDLEEGTYFYKIIITDAVENKGVKSGFIHIIR